jgi:DNA-directed RNA polymerase sigma subunit (sigma70/sigma32)
VTLYDESGAVDCHEDVYFAGDADAEHRWDSHMPTDGHRSHAKALRGAHPSTDMGTSLERLLCALTPRQRFVVECRWGFRGDDYNSLESIAEAMGISHVAVLFLYERGMARLRRGLQSGG